MRQFVVVFLLLALQARGQETVGIGQWRSYQSQAAARGAAVVGPWAVKLSDIGLVLYDRQTGELSELTKPQGLYSSRPTAVFADAGRAELVVGYADGVYERWAATDAGLVQRQRNFDIERSVFLAKGIRCGVADASTQYFGTEFGLVAFTPATNRVRFTTRQFAGALPEQAVTAVAIYGGRLWVLTPSGLFSALATGVNLADAAVWRAEHGSNGLPATGLTQLAATTARLYCVAGDGLYQYSGTSWAVNGQDAPALGATRSLGAAGAVLLSVRGASVRVIRDDGAALTQTLAAARFATYDPATGDIAVADEQRGLVVLRVDFASMGVVERLATQSVLPSNGCRQIAAHAGRLYVAPTGHTGRYQPGFSETGLYIHSKEGNRWAVLSRANGGLDNTVYHDIGALWLERSTGRCTWGSWGQGVVITQGEQRQEVINNANSPMPGLAFNPMTGRFDVHYIGGVAVDGGGNLWVSSFDAAPPLTVRTASGSWVNLPFVATRPLEIVIDRAGRKWILLADQNLSVYDDRGNVANVGSHRQRLLTAAAGQGALPGAEVLAVAEDREGLIWVGGSGGVSVFFNPSATVTGAAGGDARCPVIDGRCLLRDETVRAIVVDGANRKWVGTGRGLFLVSPDGGAVLARYTEASSPLLSDNIRDLAYDGVTGELYVATDLGIVSLRTDATEAGEETALRVFPNPAYVGESTPITVQGIAEGAVLLVTTAAGERIASPPVNGGTALWNGKDYQGRSAPPGVYLLVAARPDGSAAGVTKVAITER